MVVRLTVTADTNVYVSALHFGGKPRRLLEAARAGLFDLAISAPILAEVERVLRTKFAWDVAHVAAALRVLGGFTWLVAPERVIAAVPDDPDDDRILECAAAAGAHVVVSGDKHLLRLDAFEGVRIVTVAEFLAQYLDQFAAGPAAGGAE